MLFTTLRLLRSADACTDRYVHLRDALGANYGGDTPIPLLRVLEINGLGDAIWALRAVPSDQAKTRDRLARLLACDYAERVLPVFEREFPTDRRPRQTIAVARRFANGEASTDELTAARDAAWAAARAAAWAAARAAAWAASWAAAMDAVMAAWAAWAAERNWQTQRLREVLEADDAPR